MNRKYSYILLSAVLLYSGAARAENESNISSGESGALKSFAAALTEYFSESESTNGLSNDKAVSYLCPSVDAVATSIKCGEEDVKPNPKPNGPPIPKSFDIDDDFFDTMPVTGYVGAGTDEAGKKAEIIKQAKIKLGSMTDGYLVTQGFTCDTSSCPADKKNCKIKHRPDSDDEVPVDGDFSIDGDIASTPGPNGGTNISATVEFDADGDNYNVIPGCTSCGDGSSNCAIPE